MKAKGLILAFLACSLIFAGFSAAAMNAIVNARVQNETPYSFYVKENNNIDSTIASGFINPDSTWVGYQDAQCGGANSYWDGFLCFP